VTVAKLPAMTEAELQAEVLKLARMYGWLAFHPHDSRRSTPGYPDLTLVHSVTGALVFAELKTERGRTTREQDTWLTVLGRRHHAFVWRPADLPTIARLLGPAGQRELAGPAGWGGP
jgi:hypothetical protein